MTAATMTRDATTERVIRKLTLHAKTAADLN
jgi:hypothetical protein